jgi:hypothetical protein
VDTHCLTESEEMVLDRTSGIAKIGTVFIYLFIIIIEVLTRVVEIASKGVSIY